MNAHAHSRELAASTRLPMDLPALVVRAYAAASRFSAYTNRPDLDEDRFGELEEDAHESARAVRAKLAEIGVDPAMLRVVIA